MWPSLSHSQSEVEVEAGLWTEWNLPLILLSWSARPLPPWLFPEDINPQTLAPDGMVLL